MAETKMIMVADYRGVPVYLTQNSNPRFYAEAGGKRHFGGSFETLRKHLDAAIAFEPFDALHITRNGIEQVRITGVDMERGEWVGVDADGKPETNLKFYYEYFSPAHRRTLERCLREREEWNDAEDKIKAHRAAQFEVLKGLKIKRPDTEE